IMVQETLSRTEPRDVRSSSMVEWRAEDRRACALEVLTPTSRVRIDVTDRGVDFGAGRVPFETVGREDVAAALRGAGIAEIPRVVLDDLTRALGEADTALVTRTLSQSASVLTTGGTTTAK